MLNTVQFLGTIVDYSEIYLASRILTFRAGGVFINDTFLVSFQLTSLSVKDYNRARSYLADLANRRRVPIFEKVEEAIHCVVQKIKFPHRDIRSSSLT